MYERKKYRPAMTCSVHNVLVPLFTHIDKKDHSYVQWCTSNWKSRHILVQFVTLAIKKNSSEATICSHPCDFLYLKVSLRVWFHPLCEICTQGQGLHVPFLQLGMVFAKALCSVSSLLKVDMACKCSQTNLRRAMVNFQIWYSQESQC